MLSNRREFLKTLGAGVAALTVPGVSALSQSSAKSKNPNIIFVMADDWGYGDTTVYNPDSLIPTPNLERMASEGMIFTDAHSPAAICTPTRYAVLTGRYTWRGRLKRGVFGGYDRPLLEENRMTLGSLLQSQGYGAACIGKWHIGMNWGVKDGIDHEPGDDYNQDIIDFKKPIQDGPCDVGFDYYFGTAGCTTDDPPICYIENRRTVGIPSVMAAIDPAFENREMAMVPGFKHEEADIEYTNKAIQFMERHKQQRPDDPFFIHLLLSIPHVPWFPPEMVQGKSREGPRGDQCVLIDWCMGQLMDALDRLGVGDNTLLIVTSDNGPRPGRNGHDSSGGLRGSKGSIYEGGHRVPFIARWPDRVKAGSKTGALTTFTDMMATFAAITGAELPDDAGEDSFNILPVLEGKDDTGRTMVINHTGNEAFALRDGPWKAITRYGRPGSEPQLPGELYNLNDDPKEQNNLWDQYPDRGRKMIQTLQQQKEQGRTRMV